MDEDAVQQLLIDVMAVVVNTIAVGPVTLYVCVTNRPDAVSLPVEASGKPDHGDVHGELFGGRYDVGVDLAEEARPPRTRQ